MRCEYEVLLVEFLRNLIKYHEDTYHPSELKEYAKNRGMQGYRQGLMDNAIRKYSTLLPDGWAWVTREHRLSLKGSVPHDLSC